MRTWTPGRDGPPAQDTSTPPPTADRACPPPSPAHLITTTAPVRKGDAPKGTGKAKGWHCGFCPQLWRQHRAPCDISIIAWFPGGLWHPGLTKSPPMPLAGEEEGYVVLRCCQKWVVCCWGWGWGKWQTAQPPWLREDACISIICPVPTRGPEQPASTKGHSVVRDEAGRAFEGAAQVGC